MAWASGNKAGAPASSKVLLLLLVLLVLGLAPPDVTAIGTPRGCSSKAAVMSSAKGKGLPLQVDKTSSGKTRLDTRSRETQRHKEEEEEEELKDNMMMPQPQKERAVKKRRFAYFVTGHGFGHATRVVEVCRALLEKGHSVVVCTLCAPFIFTNELPGIEVRRVESPLDVGGVQLDALSVDVEATLCRYYDQVHVKREELIGSHARWIADSGVDMVLVDSPAVACAAAKRANRPAVVITNLIWSHIYSEYLAHCLPEHVGRYRAMIDQIGDDYACSSALLRLPGYSPMEAFQRCRRVMDMPLVVRRARKPAHVVRKELDLPDDAKVVLVTFGGQDTDWALKDEYLPPGWWGVVTLNSRAQDLPSRYRGVGQDVYMPDLVNAVDCVIGKIGYGTVSEVVAHQTPLIYVPRLHWNEQRYLLDFMQSSGTPIEMSKDDFSRGHWAPYLEAAWRLPRANNKRVYRGEAEAAKAVVHALETIAEEEEEEERKKGNGGAQREGGGGGSGDGSSITTPCGVTGAGGSKEEDAVS